MSLYEMHVCLCQVEECISVKTVALFCSWHALCQEIVGARGGCFSAQQEAWCSNLQNKL